jgi:AsmA protein
MSASLKAQSHFLETPDMETMRKILRVLGIAAGLLAALFVVAIAVLFAMFDEAAIKGELMRQVEAQTGRSLQIDGELSLSVWPDVAVRIGRVTLSEVGGKGEFAALQSARVAVAVMPLLGKRLEARHVEIDGLALTLIKRKDGTLNISDLAGGREKTSEVEAERPAGAASEPLRIEVAGVALRNARLTWRDEAVDKVTELSNLDFTSGRLFGDLATKSFAVEKLALAMRGKTAEDGFELSLAVPDLKLSDGSVAGNSLDMQATLQGAQRKLVAKIALNGATGSADRWAVDQFSFDLDATFGEAVLKARLNSPLAYEVAAQTLALEKLAGALDVTSPALPMKQLKLPLTGRLRVDLAKQSADLVLDTKFDESAIGLKLAVDKFSPLMLGFGLDIDRLNVDRYLPPAANNGAGEKGRKPAGASDGKEGKIDLAALQGLNVQGKLNVGQLQVNNLKLRRLAARIALLDGRLDVSPISAGLYGGTLDGSLRATAETNQFAVKQKLDGISIQPLLKDLLGKDPLEGRGSVSLDLQTQGATVSALKKALAGQAALSLSDGAVNGINVAKLLREVKAGLSNKSVTTTASAVEKTDFSALSASFRIAGGVAHNDDLKLTSPFLRMSGGGDIDIANERIDYLAKVSVVNTSTGQQGKSLAVLKGVTVPLRLRGPFSELAYSLELGDLVEDLAKAKLDENKEQIKAKVVEKLGDQLKGLFGR